MEQAISREKEIIRTSIIGIFANIALAAFKAGVGLLANSIAVVMDAVNNLSDALSSVITIVGTKLANLPADKKHPYGHGRIEYFSAIIIAMIVLFAGATSLIESIKKIIHPETADYSVVSLVIISVAVIVKLVLGSYVKRVGKTVNSDSLVASGSDALFDAVISLATLLSAIVMLVWHISLDSWLAAIISLVIIKAGVEMVMAPVNRLLGVRITSSYTKQIKKDVATVKGVLGAYDLLIHEYGPQMSVGSVHVEVLDTLTACEIDTITRRIQKLIANKYGIFLTVGIYAVNTHDNESAHIGHEIRQIAVAKECVMQTHGVYVNPEDKDIKFDILVSFDADDALKLREDIIREINQKYPDYHVSVNIDHDITD